MADFNTHLAVAAVSGGVAVTMMMVAGVADAQLGLSSFFAAMIGGVLPDVDAEESWTLDLAFTLFALLGSFFVMLSQAGQMSIGELVVLWLVSFLFIKLAVCELFIRCTVHRGIFHSLPAGVLFAGLTAALLYHLFRQPPWFCWVVGLFVAGGYLVHLLLDELYSLNLFGEGGVSSSLGTALKIWSADSWAALAMYLAAGMVVLLTPGLPDVLARLFSRHTLEAIQLRMWPAEVWFGLPFLHNVR
ncbi:MAG: metal-dependent hydrolase [Magnetococcales bacterium]|nr:metal-dependent hydrolase [Magnetococcales bacterium]